MPNSKNVANADLERQSLADEIADLVPQLTYQEKMTVCIACGIHEDTLTRYKTEVKKMPTARNMIAQMKAIIAKRGESVAA